MDDIMQEDNIQIDIRTALKVWADRYPDGPGGPHMDDVILEEMLSNGGLAEADDEILHHLSLCPRCMNRLSELEDEKTETTPSFFMDGAADDWYTGGMLEVASTGPVRESLVIPSSCGRFQLGIHPQADRPEQAMITIDYLGGERGDLEGRDIQVSDSKGQCLLKGKLVGGRLARMCDELTKYDLQIWTVHVKPVGQGEKSGGDPV